MSLFVCCLQIVPQAANIETKIRIFHDRCGHTGGRRGDCLHFESAVAEIRDTPKSQARGKGALRHIWWIDLAKPTSQAYLSGLFFASRNRRIEYPIRTFAP